MSLDYRDWGTFAAFGAPGLLGYLDLFVAHQDAQRILCRPPDFADTHVRSWGRITLVEAERLILLEDDDHGDALAVIRELFSKPNARIVTLYYADRLRGY